MLAIVLSRSTRQEHWASYNVRRPQSKILRGKDMSNKLVIGCGYLGSRVAMTWRAQGSQVLAMTRSEKHAQELESIGLFPLVADVTIPESLPEFPEVDTVLYCVAHDRSSQTSKRTLYIDGLRNVLERLGSRIGKFLYISSTSVYGQDSGEWIDESSECRPRKPDGEICLEAEDLVWQHFPRQPVSMQRGASILRLSGLYGPGRLNRRIERLRSGQPVGGCADAWLNLIHVDDAATSVLACEMRGRHGAVYLVSDDRPLTRREYYDALAACVGTPAARFERAGTEGAEVKHMNKRCLNKKLREELGVNLVYPSFFAGVRDAAERSCRIGPIQTRSGETMGESAKDSS